MNHLSIQSLLYLVLLVFTEELLAQTCADGCTCKAEDSSATCRAIKTVPQFSADITIRTLDMSRNILTSVALKETPFQNLPNLSSIALINCRINILTNTTFLGLHHLKHVDLSKNFLSRIPSDLFLDNPALERVSVRNNLLFTLPVDLPTIISDSLTYLDLGYNKISKLSPASFSRLPKLKSLDLSHNSLTMLEVRVFTTYTPDLISVDLSGNMWRCDSAFRRLLCWSKIPRMTCYLQDGTMERGFSSGCNQDLVMDSLIFKDIIEDPIPANFDDDTYVPSLVPRDVIRTKNKAAAGNIEEVKKNEVLHYNTNFFLTTWVLFTITLTMIAIGAAFYITHRKRGIDDSKVCNLL